MFIAPDADDSNMHWAAVDSDYLPWTEKYDDDDFDDAIHVAPYKALPQRQGQKRSEPAATDWQVHEDNMSDTDDDFSSDGHSDLDDDVVDDINLIDLF